MQMLSPVWRTLIAAVVLIGAVLALYFSGYRAAARKAEAEKAALIAAYNHSAQTAAARYAAELETALAEQKKWQDFAQGESAKLAAAMQQIDRQQAQLEKEIHETVQKDGSRFTGIGADSLRLYNRALGYPD